MSKHINFEGIDCEDLQYVRSGNCWVCLDICSELDTVDACMRCQFAKRKKIEDKIRREKKRGKVL